ncbi:GTPase Der [Buchnera aphidicola (Cinara kochiana kochiana)]|uniref:GTPase Der n=1 Tax=Buchnera aphidicola (Cinara kochiana kochiana) TaxID=2518976 RepID=A0A451D673_9GAMM|nr:ribosome biogenesis GTPase Der [Buchnera aphidicola]VFP81297.1 GTPase Der [Buchnera aphidicola (Cinara kochiana kochiana)]
MVPIITLIGQSNVGKSSLFNLLIKSNNSLISKFHQTTRDMNSGYFSIKNHQFCIIDTAGIDFFKKKETNNIIKLESYKQTKIAIKRSNLIIFVVDAYIGITKLDDFILKKIRKFNKPIILLINKIDKINLNDKIIDFYDFGIKNICKISVLHRIGIVNFLKKIYVLYKELNLNKLFDNNQKNVSISTKIKVCFVGKPNSGKSTIVNKLLNYNRIITSSIPGTTRDIITESLIVNNIEYILTDTAGINKKNKKRTFLEYISEKKSFDIMKFNQIIIIVIDVYAGICAQDLSIINRIINSGFSFFILLNKWDLITSDKKKIITSIVLNRLKFIKNIAIIKISALYKIGLKKIFKQINIIYKESLLTFSSSYLTNIVQQAVIQHPLSTGATGKIIRLKYAHFVKQNPILIIIHGTQTQYISQTYKKYLVHFLQKELHIPNTPIKIFFKNNINPYIHKI